MTLGLHFCVTKIMLQLRFVFVRHCDVFFITSKLRYSFFDIVTFFYDVRTTLYFGTFELRMEITLRLRFVFVRHCDVFFITSQLRYLFVRCGLFVFMTLELRYILVSSNCIMKLRYKMVIF